LIRWGGGPERRPFDIVADEFKKGGPVWLVGMSAGMLAEGDVPCDEGDFDGREIGGAEILPAKVFVAAARPHQIT